MEQLGNSLEMKETNHVAIQRTDGFFKKPHASYLKIPVPEDAPTPKTHGPIIEDETIPRLRHRKNDTWGEGAKRDRSMRSEGGIIRRENEPCSSSLSKTRRTGKRDYETERQEYEEDHVPS